MDLISHGLMGTMMAGFGLNKKFGLACQATLIISNIAPDFDVLACLKGPKNFYKYHREITHSLIGVGLLWVLISAGIYFFTSLHNLLIVAAMVGAGLAGHLLMDSLTPWGLPLFYPFSRKKYGFDLVWFFDPVIVISMVAGVILSFQYQGFEETFYTSSFLAILLYLTLRIIQKKRAVKMADEELTQKFKDAEKSVLPSAISPFLWDVIYTVRGHYFYVSVDTLRNEILATKETTSSNYHKCVKSSCDSELVDVFLKRSRFPYYNVRKEDTGFLVEWNDVQLRNLGGVYGVAVRLDFSGNIIGEKLQIKKPIRRRKRKLENYLTEEIN